jgi:hypothetical protein
MRLHLAVARRRRGEHIDGAAGRDLIAEADAWMRQQGIRDCARFATMLAPVLVGSGNGASSERRSLG